MSKSPEELAHLEWLGYVQPVGLVVSIPALLEAQCYVNKNVMGEHARFLGCLATDDAGEMLPEVRDLSLFTQQALDWQPQDLIEVPKSGALAGDMASLEVILPQYNETLRPTHAVPAFKPAEGQSAWIMLIQELASGVPLDQPQESDSAKHWNAPPHAKFERLLRESNVPIGLLFNRRQFRLVYAPRGETSGYATFNVDEMAQVAGRPMFAAFQMLLGADRLFNLADNQRLPHILANSRKYQNVVSTALAEQVTSALFELLRGFQAANDQRSGELLRQVLANNPQHVYHGLLTVLMRLVFVLYAEDRGLVSSEATYTNHYSVSGLFERLRSEAGRFPDTMDQRFGAWAQLLTLFRLVYEGGQHAELKIPARKGYLFDPDRYPFLEGRFDDGNVDISSDEEQSSAIQIPHISDGVIYRVLEDLLILDGERLSYRTLDVEQIGSVYEAIMGFELQVSAGKSIGIKPVKSHGAPATINLETLLAAKPADRAKLLNEWTDQKLGAGDAAALKDATSIHELVAALEKKIAKHVTPGIVPADSMVFQPSDERRRSGSHYTPRSLTQPIVRTTLEPILKQMYDPAAPLPKVYEPTREDKQRYTAGELDARVRLSRKHITATESARAVGCAHPWQILELKVCDPAMGSGAFLVETCRQLGDELIKSWYAHDMIPSDIPPDEDEVLYARRTVAQRCLYGVDKNIMAVDLAKLSLWLVTLAKDHPFTFLDHALRHGDSLVGLTREQIIGFHWEPKNQKKFGEDLIQKRLDRATEARAKILSAREDVAYRDQEQRMAVANEALNLIRLVGNVCVSCFFAADKKKAREEKLEHVFGLANAYLEELNAGKLNLKLRQSLVSEAATLHTPPNPLHPFHWQIEFPEVFSRKNGGFDAFVGNPPFLGALQLSQLLGSPAYQEWLKEIHDRAFKNADLSAYFFRQTFLHLRQTGTIGLLATQSIAEGSSRTTGLQAIIADGGTVFNARRSFRWPGEATVWVACVHIAASRTRIDETVVLDGIETNSINSRLMPSKEVSDPVSLKSNESLAFVGAAILGSGFILDETEYRELAREPRNLECLMPYLGGEQVNRSPTQTTDLYAINFGARPLEEAAKFPALLEIVRERVKPGRDRAKNHGPGNHGKKHWWQYTLRSDPLHDAIRDLDRCIVTVIHSPHLAFSFQPIRQTFVHALVVFAFESYSAFACLQSRLHEFWAKLLSSHLGKGLRYSVGDAFQTFSFPKNYDVSSDLENTGKAYYHVRASLMKSNVEGLTSIYNRFHDPYERDAGIFELRRLHGEMDMAVLRAYGWDDLADHAAQPDFCQFLLDYEEDEDEEVGSSQSSVGSGRQKKKPWRYRWPDDFRDEVLARLLELNEQRHREEQLAGAKPNSAADGKREKAKSLTKRVTKAKETDSTQTELF